MKGSEEVKENTQEEGKEMLLLIQCGMEKRKADRKHEHVDDFNCFTN